MNQFSLWLEKLRKLNLPLGKYAIFGSGILAIKNIREVSDLDIIAKKDLFDQLWEKYPECIVDKPYRCLSIEGIEFIDKWRKEESYESINKIIDNTEMIDGLPYANLQDTMLWKTKKNREKDLRDIKLIKDYLKLN